MDHLRCHVFGGLPKEIEEEVNKFLEVTPCEIQYVLQSEDAGHITMTVFYELSRRALGD